MNNAVTMAPIWIEIINGTLFIICIGIATFFGCYIVKQIQRFGFGLSGYLMSEGAIAMFVFVIGDAIVRGSIWYMRHAMNISESSAELQANGTAVAMVGVLIASLGGLCIIRIFAPQKFGPWPWIVTAALALSFGLAFAF